MKIENLYDKIGMALSSIFSYVFLGLSLLLELPQETERFLILVSALLFIMALQLRGFAYDKSI